MVFGTHARNSMAPLTWGCLTPRGRAPARMRGPFHELLNGCHCGDGFRRHPGTCRRARHRIRHGLRHRIRHELPHLNDRNRHLLPRNDRRRYGVHRTRSEGHRMVPRHWPCCRSSAIRLPSRRSHHPHGWRACAGRSRPVSRPQNGRPQNGRPRNDRPQNDRPRSANGPPSSVHPATGAVHPGVAVLRWRAGPA